MNYKVLLMEWKNIVLKTNYRLISTKAKSWYFLGVKSETNQKFTMVNSYWKLFTSMHTWVSLCHIMELSNLLLETYMISQNRAMFELLKRGRSLFLDIDVICYVKNV